MSRKNKKKEATFAPRGGKKFRCNLCGEKISGTKTESHRRTCSKLER